MLARRLGLLLFLCLFLAPCPSFAHPMGNFSVNHYSKITLDSGGIQVRYFIDLAEIPTYQEMQQYNITAETSPALTKYLEQRGTELKDGLQLTVDGQSVPLRLVSKGVIFPAGAGGLPTMKLGYVFHASLPLTTSARAVSIAYADNNFPGHAGWKEIVVDGPPALLLSSSAGTKDRSDGLTNYPTDLLHSPPQDLTATLRVAMPAQEPALSERATRTLTEASPVPTTGAVAVRPRQSATATRSIRSLQPFSAPAAREIAPPPSPQMPAMTVLANRQGTARSRFTELITTRQLSLWFLLTAACISMGLGALHALEPGHGKTIVAAYLVGQRGTARHALLLGTVVTLAHTASVFALGAVTLYASHYILPEQLYPWLGLLSGATIAALGGYLFLRRWSGEEMEHDHAAGQMHGHWFSRKKTPAASGVHLPSAEVLASGSAKKISLTQLFTLGITGGIIPCPAALVVLLSAFALHRIHFGFFLIVCFSIGLAAVLISFGLLMVYARRFMRRLQMDGPWTQRWLPLASAGFMTILGIVIAVRAFATTGITIHSFSQQKLGSALFIAGVGLVLGIRHSTDTDHVVAISTIVTRQRGLRGAALIGGLWGLGHTLTIFVVGCLIILGGVVIPPRIGLSMEFSVGLMLILLGFLNLTGWMQKIKAHFSPQRASESNTENEAPIAEAVESAAAKSWLGQERRQAATSSRGTRLRPLAIGLVHGLAGSAAVALLVLSTIHNPLWAIVYLVIFGAGTMLGMMCMTVALSMPLMYAGDRLPTLSRHLTTAAGLVSVCFGLFLVYQLGIVGGLFTSHPHWTPQ